MTVRYQEKESDSPFVQTIWHTQAVSDGWDMVVADDSWDMIITRQDGKISLTVWGPMTKAVPIPHVAGSEHLAIRFKPGTLMTYLPIHNLVDVGTILPEATSKSFWLGGSAWQFPDYENVDTFIGRLVKNHLLVRDPLVDAVLQGHAKEVSPRTIQRHFLRATGLTYSTIWQIERARNAAALLQRGIPILQVVQQAGYADQQHMTRSLKRFIGQTPTQLFHMKSE